MNEWQQVVGENFEQSDASRAFMKEVKSHIATYQAMRDAESRFPDPAQTFRDVEKVRNYARELQRFAKLFSEKWASNYRIQSVVSEGTLLSESQLKWDEVGRLATKIKEVSDDWKLGEFVNAADAYLDEVREDDDVQRKGRYLGHPQKHLVHTVTASYGRLLESEQASSMIKTEVLTAIFATFGIPTENLARTIADSIPPPH